MVAFERQVIPLYAAINGFLDEVPLEKISAFEKGFLEYLDTAKKDLLNALYTSREIKPEIEESLKTAIQDYKSIFLS